MEFSIASFAYLTYFTWYLVCVLPDDSYISHEYKVPCDASYIPENCNYPNISLDYIRNIHDFDRCAPATLSIKARNFYWGGAGSKVTYHRNFEGFGKISINPRILHDVSEHVVYTQVLGNWVRVPFGLSPVAAQKLAHPLGEIATAMASASFGNVMVHSCLSQHRLEDVANAAFSRNENAVLWMQLYIFKDRMETISILRRAEQTGYKAFVVTVDSPIFSERTCSSDIYSILRLPNLFDETFDGSKKLDDTITFRDIAWLVKSTQLPVVVKGVLSGNDAVKAAESGASAVWVSNHGGRQIEDGRATISVLPEVANALRLNYPAVEVYVDGGVRSGWDVFKAVALGARIAFVGRPIIWGLAIAGEDGVAKVLDILEKEFTESMLISGFTTPDEIREEGKFGRILTMEGTSSNELRSSCQPGRI